MKDASDIAHTHFVGANWVQVNSLYWAALIELPAAGVYYLTNPSVPNWRFGAIYYGVSGATTSEMPNTAFPLGYDMSEMNGIAPPLLCPRCTTGPDCATAVTHTCACNPCTNFDDVCEDNSDVAEPRLCIGAADTTGNPFTLMYMQNRPDSTDRRELVGGSYCFMILQSVLSCLHDNCVHFFIANHLPEN